LERPKQTENYFQHSKIIVGFIYLFKQQINMRKFELFIILLLLLFPLTGCIGDEDNDQPSETQTTGQKIPGLTAPNQHGENITLSDFEGTMLVLLLNMGEWCPYCIEAAENSTTLIEEMEAIDERYNVSFVEVLGSDETSDPADQEYAMNWSIEHNTSHHILHSEIAKDYAVDNTDGGFPCYVIVDLDGKQRLKSAGVNTITAEDVQEQYEIYLSEKNEPAN